jgi:hypothetical protein
MPQKETGERQHQCRDHDHRTGAEKPPRADLETLSSQGDEPEDRRKRSGDRQVWPEIDTD